MERDRNGTIVGKLLSFGGELGVGLEGIIIVSEDTWFEGLGASYGPSVKLPAFSVGEVRIYKIDDDKKYIPITDLKEFNEAVSGASLGVSGSGGITVEGSISLGKKYYMFIAGVSTGIGAAVKGTIMTKGREKKTVLKS
jgi:hypothetical protein